MKYLLEYNGTGAIVDIPRGASSEHWGQLERGFLGAMGALADRFAFVAMIKLDGIETACGVPYTWGLAGPDGAAFELLALPDEPAEKITAAKTELRRNRDVVSLCVRRVHKLIPFELNAGVA